MSHHDEGRIMSADLTLTRSGELDVTQVEGNTDDGIAFVDRWVPVTFGALMEVVDAGRIIIRGDEDALHKAALREGLTLEFDLVASEKASE